VAPVAGLEEGDVIVGRVAHEGAESAAVEIREGELGSGMGILTAGDHPRFCRPNRQIGQSRDLGTLRSLPLLAVPDDAGLPGLLLNSHTGVGYLLDRGKPIENSTPRSRSAAAKAWVHDAESARRSIDSPPRESAALVATGSCARASSTAAIWSAAVCWSWGVARSEQPRQGLLRPVEVGDQGVEAEAAPVGRGDPVLLGVRLHQRGVEVHHDPAGTSPGRPGPAAGSGPGGSNSLPGLVVDRIPARAQSPTTRGLARDAAGSGRRGCGTGRGWGPGVCAWPRQRRWHRRAPRPWDGDCRRLPPRREGVRQELHGYHCARCIGDGEGRVAPVVALHLPDPREKRAGMPKRVAASPYRMGNTGGMRQDLWAAGSI
jgi:hypothetical protein